MADIIRRLVVEGKTTGMAAVTSEVTSVAASLKTAGAAGVQASAGLDRAGRAGLNVAGQLHKLRMSLDEAYRMQVKFKQETEKVTNAIQQGLIPSSAEQTRILDLVRQKYDAATIAATKNAAATLAAANANRQFQSMNIAGAQAPRGAITGGRGFQSSGGGAAPPGMPPVDMIAGMGAVGGPALQKQMASQDMIAGMTGQMRQLGQQTRLTSFEVTNLGMQFNDIAVMAASGQNPMVLIMQQGMQLAQILAMSSVATLGLKATLAALGASLGQFLTNPLYLAVAAAAALAAAIMYFSKTVTSEVPPLEDTLANHADLLKRIEQSYKDAADAATGYGTAAQAASLKVLHFLEAQARSDMRASMAPASGGMPGSLGLPSGVPEPTMAFGISALRSNFEALAVYAEAVEDLRESGRDGLPDIIAFQEALTGLAHRFPELSGFASDLIVRLETLSMAQRVLEPTIRANTDAYAGLRAAIISLNPLLTRLQIAWEQAQKAYEDSVKAAERAAEEEKQRAKQAAEAAAREAKRKQEFIEQLRFEHEIMDMLEEDQAVANNLRKLGADATAAQKTEVEALTRSMEQYKQAVEAAKEADKKAMENWEDARDAAIEKMDEFRDSAKGILSAFIEGGPTAALEAFASRLATLGEDLVISGLFGEQGQAGGGIFGDAIQNLLGPIGEKPVATMNVVAGVVNVGGTGAAAGSFRAAQETGMVTMGAPGTIAGVPLATWEQEAAAAAQRGGVDPSTFLAVLRSEGLKSGIWQSEVGLGTPHRETSYGPGQFLVGGGLGDAFQAQTGLSLANQAAFADPAARQQYLDFMIAEARKTGWSPWYGAANTGIGKWQGINQDAPLTTASTTAAPAVDKLATSISGLNNPISTAVPALQNLANTILNFAPGGIAISGQAASAITSGFGGLFAEGGTLGAGRWGVAGEHGPEIIHGPASVTPMQRGGASKFNVNIKTQEGVTARVTNAQQNEDGDFDLEIFAEAIERRVRDRYGLRQSVSRWGRA